jgi:predicted S18 family serine protease
MIKHVKTREMLHADDLLSDIKKLVKKTETILKKSEKEGKYMISLAAIRELRSTYEFMCKTAKYLDERQKEEVQKEDVQQKNEEQEKRRKQLDRLDILSEEELDLMERLAQKMDGEDIDIITVTSEELSKKRKMNPKRKSKVLANEKVGKSKKKE